MIPSRRPLRSTWSEAADGAAEANSAGTVANLPKSTESSDAGLRERVCLPLLRKAQNADGGWAYRAGTGSAIEATAWCLLGLAGSGADREAIERGRRWLAGAQNEDGSWPARLETRDGNWVTALAGLALLATAGPSPEAARAAEWICQSHSAEGGLVWRLRGMLAGKKVVDQDLALRGWGWTPGTASWVEPTAVALIFLRGLPENLLPAGAGERRRMGEAMLYDRMCPGGGWNSGNPKVYGVAGIAQIGPTAWALLALQGQPEREENRRGVGWLASRFDSIQGASSLALAAIALGAYGRATPDFENRLGEHFEAGDFPHSVLPMAQAAVALTHGPGVLRRAPGKD
jgi:hypothetical protein